MIGDVDLKCISIYSFEDKMGHRTAKAAQGTLRSGAWEANLEEETPTVGDTACNISKNTRISWYTVYKEFSKKYILETQEDFQVYINVKKSKLHKVATHPRFFYAWKPLNGSSRYR